MGIHCFFNVGGLQRQGFTLIELLVGMAIATILLTMAVPAYRATIDGSRVSSELDALWSDMAFARMEAVRQGLNVMMCSSRDGRTCSGSGNWQDGWIVMLPEGGACTANSGLGANNGALLRTRPAIHGGDTVSYVNAGSGGQGVCFSRLGTTAASGVMVVNSPAAQSAPSMFNRQCLFIAKGVGNVRAARYGDAAGVC